MVKIIVATAIIWIAVYAVAFGPVGMNVWGVLPAFYGLEIFDGHADLGDVLGQTGPFAALLIYLAYAPIGVAAYAVYRYRAAIRQRIDDNVERRSQRRAAIDAMVNNQLAVTSASPAIPDNIDGFDHVTAEYRPIAWMLNERDDAGNYRYTMGQIAHRFERPLSRVAEINMQYDIRPPAGGQ